MAAKFCFKGVAGFVPSECSSTHQVHSTDLLKMAKSRTSDVLILAADITQI